MSKSRAQKKTTKAKSSPPRRQIGVIATQDRRSLGRTLLICGGLIAIIWAIFGRTLGYDFINYDDSFYVYQNSFISNGLTRAGIIRAFTNPLVGNWHPLTSFSLMSDAQMFGLHPGGYHLVNVILHTTVVLLLFFVLRAMTGARWRSAFVAAVFAIHPLRAESVVWISERKDVLSGVFFLLCLLAYVRYARKVSWGRYALVFLALALGLMAKAMLVTVPFLLLLLDYWPLRRFSFAPPVQTDEPPAWPTRSIAWLFLEKVPLLALAIGISAATIWSQEPALKAAQNWTFSGRIGNALVSFWIYLRQMVWPVHLAIFYPHPKGALPMIMVGAAAFALVVMTSAILVSRKKCPYLVTGWFWYLGMLVPVIGLLQVGWQAHADRYTYLPQIGIAIMVAWGLADLTANWRQRTVPLASAATVVLLLLLAVSWRQVGYWSDSIGLWRHTLAVTENNDVAERGLGTALLQAGQVDEAIVHDRNALRIRPGDVNGQTNLANALLRKKELPEAIALYRQVIERRPNDSEMHRNLAKALYQNGATDESVAEFREALRLRPNDSDAAYSLGNAFLEQGRVEEAIPFFKKAIASNQKNTAAHYNLAIALQRSGHGEAAIAQFRRTLQVDPRHLEAHNNLAIALLKKGEAEGAIAEWKAALQLQPNNAKMHSNLSVALLQAGRPADAVAEWKESLRLEPDMVATQITLAWVLCTAPDAALRDGRRALELARRAFAAAGDGNLIVYRILAAALAESGQFPAAIETANDGLGRADAAGQLAIAEILQRDLELYRQNIPLRDPAYGQGGSAAAAR